MAVVEEDRMKEEKKSFSFLRADHAHAWGDKERWERVERIMVRN